MDFTLTLAITVYHKPHHNEIFDSFHLFSTLFFGFDYLLYLLFPLFIFLSLVWILLLHSTLHKNVPDWYTFVLLFAFLFVLIHHIDQQHSDKQ